MDLEDLLRAIVPVTFIVVWALSSLLNRENKPAPINRPGQGFGPRPGGGGVGGGAGMPNRPGERMSTSVSRDPTLRWGPTGSSENRAGARQDDDVLVIRPEPTRAAGALLPRPGSSAGSAAARRAARARAIQAASPKRAEPAASKPLAAAPGLNMPQQIGRTLELLPPLTATPAQAANPPPAAPSAAAGAKGTTSESMPNFDFRRLVTARDRMRDAIVINEVLQPPVSRRPHHRRI